MTDPDLKRVDCVVVGGGAAGLMCAATAGALGKSVLLLEGSNKVGKKILMSGGGRCNFTNLYTDPENYISGNPHFCISALSRYTPYDFLDLVERYDLAYHEKTLGQQFCDNKSKDILNILLAECEKAGVTILTQCLIERIQSLDNSESARFQLHTNQGEFACRSLVIASGGLSIPSMGASGFGYEVAQQFGLGLTEREASLVPFIFSGRLLSLLQSLSGVALPATVTCRGQAFTEGLLFTHKGLSGPCILQASNYWYRGDEVEINFLPDDDIAGLVDRWGREGQKAKLSTLLSRLLPKRFVQVWLAHHGIDESLESKPYAQYSKAEIDRLVSCFQHWTCVPSGTEGYQTAEVTRGGVDTNEVSSKTFEANQVPGLFFIGEVLDVTGWLGGYNFQWAWASGHCAAQYV